MYFKNLVKEIASKSFTIPILDISMQKQSVYITVKDLLKGKLSKTSGPVRIYITDNGYYLGDGYHRVLEAILKGKKSIKAIKDNRFATEFTTNQLWYPDFKSPTYGLTSLGFLPEEINNIEV